MDCPKCKSRAHIVNTTRGATTLIGIGAGGYVAITAGKAGAKVGAVVGHIVAPGIGTFVGGTLGFLVGAAGGAIAGNTVGRLFDENIVRVFQCDTCGYTFRVA